MILYREQALELPLLTEHLELLVFIILFVYQAPKAVKLFWDLPQHGVEVSAKNLAAMVSRHNFGFIISDKNRKTFTHTNVFSN